MFALNFSVNEVGAITQPSGALFLLDYVVHSVTVLRIDFVESVFQAHDLVRLLGDCLTSFFAGK
ncbi:hypothetical protein A3K71_04185 [archaeon RBG_16_50_20]|nr:MAG: hypothetical protein A3K71_04185 [archaeon RBG_16_50_20]